MLAIRNAGETAAARNAGSEILKEALVKPIPSFAPTDAILSSEEPDASRVAWTPDEFDRSTDLASLHFALPGMDERYAQV